MCEVCEWSSYWEDDEEVLFDKEPLEMDCGV